MAEKTFLEEGDVKVTNARIIVGNATYQLSHISQVKLVVAAGSKAGIIWILIIGALLIVIGITGILNIDVIVNYILFFAGIAFISWAISKYIDQKKSFSISLSTTAGRVYALTSKDKEFIEKVIQAINEAIASNA